MSRHPDGTSFPIIPSDEIKMYFTTALPLSKIYLNLPLFKIYLNTRHAPRFHSFSFWRAQATPGPQSAPAHKCGAGRVLLRGRPVLPRGHARPPALAACSLARRTTPADLSPVGPMGMHN